MTTTEPQDRTTTAVDPETDGTNMPAIIASRPIAAMGGFEPTAAQELELNRQYVQIIGAIGAMSWGQRLTPGLRKAVAEYCRQHDVDPLTELDVLGGKFYINAAWYHRKLGDLRRRRIVADFWIEHIHADPRLHAMMTDERYPEPVRADARQRWAEKAMKRIEFNAPEEAAAIAVCYIQLPDGGHPIVGVKWGGNGTSMKQPKGGGGSQPNPIVEANPELSVTSQAIRRAMRQVQTHLSDVVGAEDVFPDIKAMESDFKDASERARNIRHAQRRIDARLAKEAKQRPPVVLEAAGEAAPGLSQQQIADIAAQPDPYTGELPKVKCADCEQMIRPGHPEDHNPDCAQYADP
jgi:hypothetical protein